MPDKMKVPDIMLNKNNYWTVFLKHLWVQWQEKIISHRKEYLILLNVCTCFHCMTVAAYLICHCTTSGFLGSFGILFYLFFKFIFVVVCRIFSCDMQTLSYGVWDLVPWPGIKPGLHALGGSLSHWIIREISLWNLIMQKCFRL